MTPHDFCNYLNGFRDALPKDQPPNAAQWVAVQKALQSVFVKETPDRYNNGGETINSSDFIITSISC